MNLLDRCFFFGSDRYVGCIWNQFLMRVAGGSFKLQADVDREMVGIEIAQAAHSLKLEI